MARNTTPRRGWRLVHRLIFTALLLILALPLPALASDPIQFSPADSYALSTTQFRMTSGDFNQDGWPDLVVVQDNTKYSILMNNDAGGFTTATYTVTGARLRDAVVVNLAGDTIPDLVLSDWTGSKIQVLTGSGAGTFTLNPSVAAGGAAEGIAAGDFNGDGYPDVAVCLRSALKVSVLLGTAGGSFVAGPTYTTGACDDLAVGLVNADGYQDIVTANLTNDDLSVLAGNGDGTFGTPVNIPCGNDNTDVALADIDHDGKLDAVVAAYASNAVIIMLGDGAGGFTFSQSLPVNAGPNQVRVADFNLDGFLDVVTANSSAAPGLSILQATGYNVFMAAAPFHPDQKANGLAIADFNKDIGPDVATSHPTNSTVRVMKVVLTTDTDGDGMPDGWENQYACLNPLVGDSALDADSDGLRNIEEFTHHTDPCAADSDGDGLSDGAEVNTYLTDPTKADTDNDGMPDNYEILNACLNPAVNDASADPDGDLWTNLYEYQHATDPCVFNDADGDGMPDAWEIQYASCGLDPNVNDAGLDPDADTLTNLQEYLAHTNPCVVNDTDGDGMPDHYEALHACLNPAVNDAGADPDGDLMNNFYEFQHATDPCVAIDTDGDGMPDAWENQYPCLDRLVNDAALDANGNGVTNLAEYQAGKNPCALAFSPADSYLLSASLLRMTTGDFNRDGHPDLAVVHDNTKYSILMNNGAGGFTTATYTITGAQLKDVVVVQLAGDTIPDLALSDRSGASVRVLTGAGNGTFTLTASVPAGGAEGIAAGDFNADGYPDVAVCLFTTSQVAVLLGTSGGGFGTAATYTTGVCDDLAVGLVNADGYQDLVTANWSSDNISVLLGNGDGTFATATNIPCGNDNSDVALADINHDGKLDAVVASYANKTAVIMLGDGLGGFALSQALSVVTGPQQVRVADFNQDGFLDLATANAGAAPGLAILQATGYNTFFAAATFHSDQKANGLAIADFNGDGGLDVATSHPTNSTVRVMKVIPSTDTDGDGMPDNWENQYLCMNPLVGDSTLDADSDGLRNIQEYAHAADPCLADTDGDGLSDGAEVNLYLTDPTKPDTDGDGMPDNFEVLHSCLNPTIADGALDFDGDVATNLYEYQHVTDPCVADDADGDGMPDAWEVQYSSCGLDPNVNDAGLDPDNDGLTNLQEFQAHTDPCVSSDTDSDGLSDVDEVNVYHTDPTKADTDGDGFSDGYEVSQGSNPLDPASFPGVVKAAGDERVTFSPADEVTPNLVWTGSEFGLAWEGGHTTCTCEPFACPWVTCSSIEFRRMSASGRIGPGTSVGNEIGVSQVPVLVWTGSEYGVSYSDWRDCWGGPCEDPSNPPASTIYFSRISGSGGKLGGDTKLSPGAYRNCPYSTRTGIVWTGSQFGVSWSECGWLDYSLGYSTHFEFSRVDANGSAIGIRSVHALLSLSLGGYTALAWTGSEYGYGYSYTEYDGYDTQNDYMSFDRLGVDGSKLVEQMVGQIKAPISLAWSGSEFGLSHNHTFQRISAAGDPVGTALTFTTRNNGDPQVFWTGSEYGIGWQDNTTGSGKEIYLTRVSAAGQKIGADLRLTFDAAISSNPSFVFTGSEYAVAWQDSRDGNHEIYFTRFQLDSDGDGLSDADETNLYSTNPADWDTDGDGLADGYEIAHGLDPLINDTALDLDHDGLSNLREFQLGTNPQNPDTDGDGVPDGVEAASGCMSPLIADGLLDPDQDGLSNALEYQSGTDPCDPDTDGDGLSDGFEVGVVVGAGPDGVLATAPGSGDVLHDNAIWLGTDLVPNTTATGDDRQVIPLVRSYPRLFITNPLLADSDGDGVDDRTELIWGANPLDPAIKLSLANVGTVLSVATWDNNRYPANFNELSLAWTGSEYGLAWQDNRDDGTTFKFEIYFVRLTPSGAKIGADLRLTADANESRKPVLRWTGTQYGLFWQDNRTGAYELYFTRLSAAGVKQGGDLLVTASDALASHSPAAKWTGSEYGLAWVDDKDGNQEIYFSRVDAAGSRFGGDVRLTESVDNDSDPAVAWTGSQWGIAWTQQPYFPYSGPDYLVRLAADGSRLGPNLLVDQNASCLDKNNPALAWSGSEFGMRSFSYFSTIAGATVSNYIRSGTYQFAASNSMIAVDGLFAVLREGAYLPPPPWLTCTDGTSPHLDVVSPGSGGSGASVQLPLWASDQGPRTSNDLVWTGSEFGVSWISNDHTTLSETMRFSRVTIDRDGDGIADVDEAAGCTDPLNYDTDFDGIADQADPDPCDFDSDGDGIRDHYELAHSCLDVNVPDGGLDPDGDGLTSLQEYQYSPLMNACNPDSDGDGLPDGWEFQSQACGFDPVSKSSEIVPAKIGGDLQVTSECNVGTASLLWTGSEFGMSWEDCRPGNWEIYFARLSPDGNKIGVDERVSQNGANSNAPSLAWTGSEFGVSWHDQRDGIDPEIYFARISATGAKIGADIRVTFNSLASYGPSLVWTGSEFGVSWQDSRNGNYEIYFTRISAAGVKIGADVRLTSATGDSQYPSLSWTGSEFGVSWYDHRDGNDEIYFARVSAAGAKIGADLRLTSNPGVSELPALAWTGSEFGVSWYESTYEIHFARISAAGVKIGSDLRLSSATSPGNKSALVWTGSEFGVGWFDYRNSNVDIYFVHVSAAGSKTGADLRVTNPIGWNEYPALAWSGSEFGVSWINNVYLFFARIGGAGYTDKDGDGLREDQEYALGTNPCVADTDGDGLSDGAEFNTYLTNPLVADSDGDGLSDGFEVNTSHTNPLLADTDGDGLSDGYEVNISHSDPMNWDSDGDHLPDKYEVDHAGLDPLNALDAAADFDGDGNSNVNEYYNGSDPWSKDPVPGVYANPGCYYWGDGDGDGIPAPSDLIALKLEVAGVPQAYRDILPHGTDTLDLDRDGYAAPADLITLKLMVAGSERPGGYDSQAASLEVVSAPSGSVAAGSTTHVTVSVNSVGGVHPHAPGFGVVFEVVSGNAVLLGGDGTADGEPAGNRYDVSMEADLGAQANIVVLVTGPGPVTIGAKIPACGTFPYGRWNNEVVLAPPVVINP